MVDCAYDLIKNAVGSVVGKLTGGGLAAVDAARDVHHGLVSEEGAVRSRFVPAALAGMVAIAVFGALLYGVLFAKLFEANMGPATGVLKSPPDLLWVGLAHVPFGVLLTLVVSWRGATSARGGALTGAILGFLMAASYDLSQYGTTNLWTLKLTLIEPLITTVMVGAAGAVVGVVLGLGSATRSEIG